MNTIFNDGWVALKKSGSRCSFVFESSVEMVSVLHILFCRKLVVAVFLSHCTAPARADYCSNLRQKNCSAFQLILLSFHNTSPSHILAQCCSTFDVTCSTFGKASHNPADKYAQVQTMDVVCGRYNIPCLVLCSLRYTSGSRNLVEWWTRNKTIFTEHSCFLTELVSPNFAAKKENWI